MSFDNSLDYAILQKRIEYYAKKYKNKKVILYGAGKYAQKIIKNCNFQKLNIIAIADKKFDENANLKFNNFQAISPEFLKEIDCDLILILNKDYKLFIEIINKLLYGTKNSNVDIFSIFEPIKKEYIKNYLSSLFNQNKFIVKHRNLKKFKNKKIIFTFWEPRNKLPAYLNLCLETWKKFLPEYEIIILDYTNIDEYLGKNYFDKYLYKNFNLAKQADMIRAVLLYTYGGLWLDIDTIITSEKFKELIPDEPEIITIEKHLALIKAKKNARFLKNWIKIGKKKIAQHKKYKNNTAFYNFSYGYKKCLHFNSWDYLGNSIVNSLYEKHKNYKSLDKNECFAFPENAYFLEDKRDSIEKYKDFYFSNNNHSDFILNNEKGVILLHNSWTPYKYKQMSKEEFLESNTTLANTFKKILNLGENKL